MKSDDIEFNDPVLKEIHEIRRAIMAEYGNDVLAYLRDLAAHPVPGVKYVRIPKYANRLKPIPFRYPETTSNDGPYEVAEAESAP